MQRNIFLKLFLASFSAQSEDKNKCTLGFCPKPMDFGNHHEGFTLGFLHPKKHFTRTFIHSSKLINEHPMFAILVRF